MPACRKKSRKSPLHIVLCSWHCLALSVLAVGFTGCTGRRESPGAPRKFDGNYPIRAVSTTGPVTDLVRSIGGAHVDVTGLMGPGVDPHLYNAVPVDIEKLNSADIIFYNGLHLEGRMADLFEKLSDRRPTFAVAHSLLTSKDARLRKPPEFEGYYDPHVWHDPQLWGECAKYVSDVLMQFDPTHAEEYASNRDAYLNKLQDLDEANRKKLMTIPESERVLVTAHDAFGYFCLTYGLKSMPLKGVSTEEEVSIRRVDEVIAFLVKNKIKAVFVESAASPQIVERLIKPCARQGHEVTIGGELYADALGPRESGADSYVGMMSANVDTIVKALGGSESE